MNKLSKSLLVGLLEQENYITAFFGGGFKPPTKGHFEVVKQSLEQNPDIDKLYVVVGSGIRDGVSQDESYSIWNIYKKYLGDKVEVVKADSSPLKYVKDYIKTNTEHKSIILIGSREGNDEDANDFKKRKTFFEKYGNHVVVKDVVTAGGISGTKAREAAKISKEQFFQYLPTQLTDEEKNLIFSYIQSVIQEKSYLDEDIPKFNQPKTIQQYLIENINEINLSKENAVDTNGDLTGGTFKVGDIVYEYSIKNISNPYKDLGLFYNIQFTPRGEVTSIPKGGKENYIKILSTMYKIIVDFIEKEKPEYLGISSLDNNKNYHTVYNRLTDNPSNLIPGYFRKDSNLKFNSPQGEGRFIVLKRKKNLNENASYSKDIDYKKHILELTKHMLDKGMNIKPLPKVIFNNGDVENAREFFGRTAYYNPNTNTIVLYTEGRHPKDIVRSFAHEMIHHIQNLEGRLENISTTNTHEDDHLNDIEAEANLKGTMTFRNWTDSLNEISLPKATQQISKLNPEVDAEEVAKDFIRLSPNLGKKDLFQYSTYDELKKELDKASQSKSQRRNQAKSMDLEDNKFIFYKDDNFTIYKLDNPSQHPESCEIAQGAKICVASNSKKYWNKYMIDGDGVLFYIRNKEYDIPHPQSVIAFMFPRKGLKMGYTEMVDYNDEDFVQHGNYEEQKGYLSSIGIPSNVIEKMFKFIPDVKPLSYYIKNHKGKKNKLKVDGKTYFFYTPDAPPSIGDPKVFEDENGKVIGVIKPKGYINKLSPLEKKWLKFRFPDLPDSVIYEVTNVNKYWEENQREINLYNIENNKLVKVGKAHLPYGPEEINTLMSGSTLDKPINEAKPYKHKHGFDDKLGKDPFGLNQFAREIAEETLGEADPKKGTGKKPKGSGRRLYTDEDPKDTVGIKFRTKEDIVDTLNKKSFKAKPHARQSQIINLIHQRVRAAYQNAKDPDTKARLKRGLDYIEKRKESSKKKTQRLKKLKEQQLDKFGGDASPESQPKMSFEDRLEYYKNYYTNVSPSTFDIILEDGTIVIGGLDKPYPKDFNDVYDTRQVPVNENVPDAKDDGKAAPYGSGYEKVKEGDTIEKYSAKGKSTGKLKQGTVRKRLGIPKGEKIPLSLINKELARLRKMDKDPDKKGAQLGDKNRKYYKALQLAKTLKTTTNLNEGRYDTLTNQLSKIAFELFKSAHDRGDKKDDFEFRVDHPDEEHDIPSNEFYFDFEGNVEITDGEYFVDGGANTGFDNEGEEITPVLSIKFKIPKNPDWQRVSMDIKDVVRHELEHLTQDGDNLKSGKFLDDDQTIRDLIDLDLLPKADYFRLPKEIDAMLQGLYFKAKKSKRPYREVIDDYLATQPINTEEKENILKVWRSRAKALSLPLFEDKTMSEAENTNYVIYCDMDGVLVDFEKRFTKLSDGIPPREYESKNGKDKFWDLIDNVGGVGFWVGMPWMPSGKQLWEYISPNTPILLSSPSRSEKSRLGKRLWVRNNLPGTKLILANSYNKKNYAEENHILIDDRQSNIDQWRAAGGIGILFTSTNQTIQELKELGL